MRSVTITKEREPRKVQPKQTLNEKLSQIKNAKNRQTIEKYIKEQKAMGRSASRIKKISWQLVNISNWLGKEFTKANKEDITALINHIQENGYKQWTVIDYKVLVKRFYKWSEGKDEIYPEKVRWIKDIKKGLKDTVKASDLLTKEDVIRMIESTTSLRNKALISVLYETGIRVGELLNIKLRDIDMHNAEQMMIIEVTGKTGTRQVFMRGLKKHLLDYLNSHPTRNDKSSYLWVALDGSENKRPIDDARVRNMLKNVARRAKIDKHVKPHLFRHSLATHMAGILTEGEMKGVFGWTNKSDMPSVYVHLSAHDVKNAVASKVYGLTNGEIKQKEDALKPKLCDECGRENPADAKFCNCGTVLDIKTAIAMDVKLKDARYVEKQLSGDMIKMYAQIQEMERKFKALASAK